MLTLLLGIEWLRAPFPALLNTVQEARLDSALQDVAGQPEPWDSLSETRWGRREPAAQGQERERPSGLEAAGEADAEP